MGHLLSFSNNFRNDLIFTVSLYLLFQCLLLNVTYCPPSETDFSKGKSLVSFGINSCIAPSEVPFFSSPMLLKQKINCVPSTIFFQYIIFFFRLFLCTTHLAGNEKMFFVCQYAIVHYSLQKKLFCFCVSIIFSFIRKQLHLTFDLIYH